MPGEELNRPATGPHYNLTLRVSKALFGFPLNKLANSRAFQLHLSARKSFPAPKSEHDRNVVPNPDCEWQ